MMKKTICLLLILCVSLVGCTGTKEPAEAQTTVPTRLSPEEYPALGRHDWFLTGKKAYSIRAMTVSSEISFHNDPRSGYNAMSVPNGIPVTAETARGDVFHANLANAPHSAADYLLCSAEEDGKPDLSDVGIVNGVPYGQAASVSFRFFTLRKTAALMIVTNTSVIAAARIHATTLTLRSNCTNGCSSARTMA